MDTSNPHQLTQQTHCRDDGRTLDGASRKEKFSTCTSDLSALVYEASAFLAAFVLLEHWFEMRARRGANDAMRALLDLAPPKAVVARHGEELELPTAEVEVGDLLVIRPGAKVPVDAHSNRWLLVRGIKEPMAHHAGHPDDPSGVPTVATLET